MANELIRISNHNYDFKDCFFVFRVENDFKELFNQLNLNLKGIKYIYSENDSHWSCKGHQIASEKILEYID